MKLESGKHLPASNWTKEIILRMNFLLALHKLTTNVCHRGIN